ncbi:MAG: LacI family DNA-binding transcriptional regulator [Christensenellales bacterium]
MKELADYVGVSIATVSRAFSGKGYINDITRKKILAVAKMYSYQPRKYQKKEKSIHLNTIAVVVPDIHNTYFMEVIQGIERVVERHGIEVVICNTDERPDKEIRCLDMLVQMGISGVIAVPVSIEETFNAEYLINMNNNNTPIVLLDRDLPSCNLDGVFMDNYNGAYQATQKLIMNNHKNIAIISGPITSSSGLARLDGYRAALDKHHIPMQEDLILRGDFKFDLSYKLTKDLITSRPDVTAIFATNSRMSLGSLYALAELHIVIPDDIAFISCGRLGLEYGSITSVLYPTETIGEECANILLTKMRMGKTINQAVNIRRKVFEMKWQLQGSEKYPQRMFRP